MAGQADFSVAISVHDRPSRFVQLENPWVAVRHRKAGSSLCPVQWLPRLQALLSVFFLEGKMLETAALSLPLTDRAIKCCSFISLSSEKAGLGGWKL